MVLFIPDLATALIADKGKASLIKGVANNRRISVADIEMRHGRKSRSVRSLDTNAMCFTIELLVSSVRWAARLRVLAEASVTKEIGADLEQQGVHVTELHIDRGYLRSYVVRERSDEREIYCKACPRGEALLETGMYPGLGPAEHSLSSRTGDALCPRWGCAFSQRILRSVSLESAMHNERERAQCE